MPWYLMITLFGLETSPALEPSTACDYMNVIRSLLPILN